MDIGATRDAIAQQLESILSDVRVYPVFPDPPQPPFIAIVPEPFDYPATEDDKLDITFKLICVAGEWDSRAAQQTLDGWVSNSTVTSLIATIRNDESLGGVVSSASVTKLLDYTPIVGTDGARYMSATLQLEVYE